MRYMAVFSFVISAYFLTGCSQFSSFTDTYSYQPRVEQKRQTVIRAARQQVGIFYRWGGTHPENGLDCSGLTQYTYRQAGLNLPRIANEQFAQARLVKQPKPGDLLFYGRKQYATHVGIYIGQNQMIHAPGTGRQVKIVSINSPYWKQRYLGAGSLSALTMNH